MKLSRRRLAVVAGTFLGLAVASAPGDAQAVILARTSTRNTYAPVGTNYNSGWQYQGNWANGFTGTPIGKNYFLSASHVGGGVGQNIWYAGKNWTTTAVYDDPTSDLVIYKVSGNFPSWAPIYTGTSETGKRAMVFGRGTTRGSNVNIGTTLHGWKWGTQDKVRSWGENNVAGVMDAGSGLGQLLKFTFNKAGSSGSLYNEGTLSSGDSAGGVFINDGGTWKLAGINYAVDGPFSFTGTSGSGFNASLFDKGGLYQGGDGAWRKNTDTSADINGNWYATRVSAHQGWIKSILNGSTTAAYPAATSSVSVVPEPTSVGLLGIAATALLRRRKRRR
jgi:hypothetical protein